MADTSENPVSPWGETPNSRLRWARERRFETAAAFVRAHPGIITEGTYRSFENGQRPVTLRAAQMLGPLLEVSSQWLLFGDMPEPTVKPVISASETTAVVEPTAVPEAEPATPPFVPEHRVINILGADYGLVPVFDLRLIGGPGAWLPDERGIPQRYAPYHLAWLRELTSSPLHRLMALRVSGDAMEPTLLPGDYILVDRNRRRIEDGIYALRQNTSLQLKRIAVHASTCLLRVISDNPHYPREDDVLPAQIDVIGRVIWVSRTL